MEAAAGGDVNTRSSPGKHVPALWVSGGDGRRMPCYTEVRQPAGSRESVRSGSREAFGPLDHLARCPGGRGPVVSSVHSLQPTR